MKNKIIPEPKGKIVTLNPQRKGYTNWMMLGMSTQSPVRSVPTLTKKSKTTYGPY